MSQEEAVEASDERQAPAGAATGAVDAGLMPPLWLLMLITISGSIAMHLFLPALSDAARDLRAGAGEVQMAISVYLVGLAVGQLFYGPLSDAFGRRPVLLSGLLLYVAGGLAAALAPDVQALIAARAVQALGACAGMALGRVIVRDTAAADSMIRYLALLNLMVMIAPGFAPMLGGLLSAHLGWRSIFGALAALGGLTAWVVWRRLPETGQPTRQFGARRLLAGYRELLASPSFVAFALGGGAITTASYAFLAAAPFILGPQLHLPVEAVGVISGLVVLGAGVGNVLTSALVRRFGSVRLMQAGLAITVLAASALLAVVVLHRLSVTNLLVTMLLFTCGIGMVNPTVLARALNVNPRLSGTAAGLYGCVQMGLGAMAISLASLGGDPATTTSAVLLGIGVFSSACILTGLWYERRLAL